VDRGGLCPWRLPDARGGLHMERHHRPRLRRLGGADAIAADSVGAGDGEGRHRLDVHPDGDC